MNSDIFNLISSFASNETPCSPPPAAIPVKTHYASGYLGRGHGVLCFSKDRPFQLDAFLNSVSLHLRPHPELIVVLYTSEPEWGVHYEKVFARHQQVLAIQEKHFPSDFQHCLDLFREQVGFVTFCVDDMLFIEDVSMSSITEVLSDCDDVYGVHLKLHPGICYSHPASCSCPPPPLTRLVLRHPQSSDDSILPDQPVLLKFGVEKGPPSDWSYPFDLCAGTYRLDDICTIVRSIHRIHGPEAIVNPNVLEVLGNEVMWSEYMRPGRIGVCLSAPCCVVVTVNKVQTTFAVPVYHTAGGDLNTLNGYVLNRDKVLDSARYRRQLYSTVHVEDLFLKCPADIEGGIGGILPDPSPVDAVGLPLVDVSVLLPVHNEEQFLLRCLDSILRQKLSIRVEVVVVLNGCTDNSEVIVRSYETSFEECQMDLNIVILPEKGLILALDAGLARCRGRYIARIDADDAIINPLRLVTQVQYLDEHYPRIRVVGTQALLVPDDRDDKPAAQMTVAGNIPCSPVSIAWMMLFRCVVLHPSVMFHRDSILAVGGYGGTLGIQARENLTDEDMGRNRVEDYSLWVRILSRYPLSIANIPDVTMAIQQRQGSKSYTQRSSATSDGMVVRRSLLNHYLQNVPDSLDFLSQCVENPYDMTSASACRLSPEEEESCLFHISHPHLVSSPADLLKTCRFLRALMDSVFIPLIPESLRSAESLHVLRKHKEILSLKLISGGCTALSCSDVNFKTHCCEILDVDYVTVFRYELMASFS